MKNLISKNDKIFVAGHKGMVGKAICSSLFKHGYKSILFAPREELDLTKYSEVQNWFKKNNPDVVVLAAAKVGGILANRDYPYEFLSENLKIQTNIIENSFDNNIKRLLFLGSSCIYPKYAHQPIREESLLTGELELTNEWYAIAKITGVKLCAALKKQYNFDAFSLMPTNLYGPGDNYKNNESHVLPALIRKFSEASDCNSNLVECWGTGKAMREFLHVNDLAEACVFCLEKFNPERNAINFLNIGSGEEVSIKDLASLISKEVGFKGQIFWDQSKPDGTPRKRLDLGRLNKLGWEAKIKLKDGLRDSIYDFKLNKNLRR